MKLRYSIHKKYLTAIAMMVVLTFILAPAKAFSESPPPKVSPEDYKSYIYRGEYYQNQDKYDLAEKDYLKAVEILEKTNPKQEAERDEKYRQLYIYHYFYLRWLYYLEGKWDEAIDIYQKLLGDEYQEIFSYTGESFSNDSEINDKNMFLFSYYDTLGSHSRIDQKYEIQNHLAVIYAFTKKDYPQALFYYDKNVELRPTSYRPYFARAEAKAKFKDWQGAENDYATALKLSPDNVEIISKRAFYLHRQRGDYRAARADCKKVKRLKAQAEDFEIEHASFLCRLIREELREKKKRKNNPHP